MDEAIIETVCSIMYIAAGLWHTHIDRAREKVVGICVAAVQGVPQLLEEEDTVYMTFSSSSMVIHIVLVVLLGYYYSE